MFLSTFVDHNIFSCTAADAHYLTQPTTGKVSSNGSSAISTSCESLVISSLGYEKEKHHINENRLLTCSGVRAVFHRCTCSVSQVYIS